MTKYGEGSRSACHDCGLYLLGALSPDAVVAFKAHLLDCCDCQDECEALGSIVSAMIGLSPADIEEMHPHPEAL